MWWLSVSIAVAVPDGFWATWGDGKAEVSGYALTMPRYGELRRGEAVLITVTETFTHGQRVKSDGGRDDEYPVLKVNAVMDFQTGIYDYDTTTSVFVPLDDRAPTGRPTKIAFASEEWCGIVFDMYKVDGPALRWTSHSYFDGEADRYRVLPVPEAGIFLDAAPILVRGLLGDALAPGERRELPVLPTMLDQRLGHTDPAWEIGTLERSAQTIAVPSVLGDRNAYEVTVQLPGRTTTWTVEADPPHRILGWRRDDGLTAQLTGTLRTAYWTQNGEGGEAVRQSLGLPPDPWHAPATP